MRSCTLHTGWTGERADPNHGELGYRGRFILSRWISCLWRCSTTNFLVKCKPSRDKSFPDATSPAVLIFFVTTETGGCQDGREWFECAVNTWLCDRLDTKQRPMVTLQRWYAGYSWKHPCVLPASLYTHTHTAHRLCIHDHKMFREPSIILRRCMLVKKSRLDVRLFPTFSQYPLTSAHLT